jgi:hypothetical protein
MIPTYHIKMRELKYLANGVSLRAEAEVSKALSEIFFQPSRLISLRNHQPSTLNTLKLKQNNPSRVFLLEECNPSYEVNPDLYIQQRIICILSY